MHNLKHTMLGLYNYKNEVYDDILDCLETSDRGR